MATFTFWLFLFFGTFIGASNAALADLVELKATIWGFTLIYFATFCYFKPSVEEEEKMSFSEFKFSTPGKMLLMVIIFFFLLESAPAVSELFGIGKDTIAIQGYEIWKALTGFLIAILALVLRPFVHLFFIHIALFLGFSSILGLTETLVDAARKDQVSCTLVKTEGQVVEECMVKNPKPKGKMYPLKFRITTQEM